jgi:hypothetical protein
MRKAQDHSPNSLSQLSAARILCLSGIALSLLSTSPARSEEDVVVRGSGVQGFTSRANVDDARREVTDAASLVEALPGVHVRRSGGDDSFSTISVRGSGSNQVAIYLAGVPLSGGADPTLDLSSLPLWPGARARVYRSFAPAALGPGSLGGTLVLDPPRPAGPAKTEVWSAVGSFGSRRLRAADDRPFTWGEGGPAHIVTSLTASRSDDDFSYYDPRSGGFVPLTNAGHTAVHGLVSVVRPVAWTAGAIGSVRLTTMAQARRSHLPGTRSAPTPDAQLDSSRWVSVLELAGPLAQGAWTARAWGRRDDLTLRSSADTFTLAPTHTADALLAAGGSLGWRGRPAKALTVETRVDASGERFAPGTYLGPAQASPASRVSAGLGADAVLRATEAWSFAASGRADVRSDGAAMESKSEARPTGHLGTEISSGPVVVSAHGGALARPPSFVERFGTRGTFLGDPALRTESAWTGDAGVHLAAGRGKVRWSSELVGFGTWATDLIAFVPVGAYGRPKATNIGAARLFGAELALDIMVHMIDLHVSYTGLATANESACAATAGPCERPPLPLRPEHDVVGDLGIALGPTRIRYGVDAMSGMRGDLAGDLRVPPRVVQSAGVRLDVPHVRGLRLSFDLRNLFDVRTATYAGAFGSVREPIGDSVQYPLPGRSFLLTARWVSPE